MSRSKPMRLIIVRHGETESNAKKIVMGHIQGKLSKKGKAQVKRLGLRLRNEKIDIILSSDLKRSRDTTLAIARFHKAPTHYLKTLRELNLGKFQGKPQKYYLEARISSGLPDVNFRAEGGESLADGLKRVRPLINSLYKKYKGKTVLISTHYGMICCIVSIYLKIPLAKAWEMGAVNTGILILEVKGRKARKIKDDMFLKPARR